MENLAYLVGVLTGDGHIQQDNFRNLVSFYSKNIYEIKFIKSEVNKLFRIKGFVYKDDRRGNIRYKLFFNSKYLVNFLIGNGVPEGNKTNSNFLVPNWIFYGKNKLKSYYLKGMYDSEGSIFSTKSGKKDRWRINIRQNKNEMLKTSGFNFMNQLKSMLNEFGVISSPIRYDKGTLRKDGTKSISILFDIERKSFENFYKYVGFRNKDKQNKLIFAMHTC